MDKYNKLNIGGQEFVGRVKIVNQMSLTSDCWMVQVWGLPYCSGFGDPSRACEYLGTKECGGERIRKSISEGNFPIDGLPDVSKQRG